MTRLLRVTVALLVAALVAAVWHSVERPIADESGESRRIGAGAAQNAIATASRSGVAKRVRTEEPAAGSPAAPQGTVSFRLRAPEGVRPSAFRVAGMASLAGPVQVIDQERPWSDDTVRIAVPAGRAQLTVAVHGCASAQRSAVVTAGADTPLGEIVLEPGCSIGGRIVDAAGRPVEAAEVRFAREREGPLEFGEEGMRLSSASGEFSFDCGRAGRFELCVRAAGYLTDRRTLEVSAATLPLTVTLFRGGSVRGIVRDGTGALVSGVRVAIAAEGSDQAALLLRMDESASFSERLTPGRWHVAVRDDEGEEIAARDVDVTEGSTLDVDLRVER